MAMNIFRTCIQQHLFAYKNVYEDFINRMIRSSANCTIKNRITKIAMALNATHQGFSFLKNITSVMILYNPSTGN
jgi:hypothetical protein